MASAKILKDADTIDVGISFDAQIGWYQIPFTGLTVTELQAGFDEVSAEFEADGLEVGLLDTVGEVVTIDAVRTAILHCHATEAVQVGVVRGRILAAFSFANAKRWTPLKAPEVGDITIIDPASQTSLADRLGLPKLNGVTTTVSLLSVAIIVVVGFVIYEQRKVL